MSKAGAGGWNQGNVLRRLGFPKKWKVCPMEQRKKSPREVGGSKRGKWEGGKKRNRVGFKGLGGASHFAVELDT